ncbi:MAG: hypothetical protein Q4E63_02480 [Prevotellaceae bacterium]|nr:hypothetical protein [Prevotellaceae bacterium]MDO4931510.1 hypothetical protein [Prevotellaceae bacterium]
MRRTITLIAALMAMGTAMAKDRSALQITFNDGKVATIRTENGLFFMRRYDLENKEFYLEVYANSETTTYQFKDLKTLRFIDTATDVSAPLDDAATAAGLAFSINGKTVTVNGADTDGMAVYGIDGTKQAARVTGGNGMVTVDLTSCPAGDYIIKLKSNSIKVRIK